MRAPRFVDDALLRCVRDIISLEAPTAVEHRKKALLVRLSKSFISFSGSRDLLSHHLASTAGQIYNFRLSRACHPPALSALSTLYPSTLVLKATLPAPPTADMAKVRVIHRPASKSH